LPFCRRGFQLQEIRVEIFLSSDSPPLWRDLCWFTIWRSPAATWPAVLVVLEFSFEILVFSRCVIAIATQL
jgi:hypothetical protein